MVTFTLDTPFQTGTFDKPVAVSRLLLTGIKYSSTPELGAIGTSTLDVTLTDPDSRQQFKFSYQDATAPDVWADVSATFASAVFNKLIADGKLPAGSIDTGETAQLGKTNQVQQAGTDTTSDPASIVGL
jgi:hypothetical protein